MMVQNLIHMLAPDSKADRRPEDVEYLVVHRVGWVDRQEWTQQGYPMDAVGVRDFYAKALGWTLPYAIMVGLGGETWQGRRLLDVTPHALAFNKGAIGLGVLGDFRLLPPERLQWNACVDFAAKLLTLWPHLEVVGHTELGDRATTQKGKQCPGKLFDMNCFRQEVERFRFENAAQRLTQMGITI